jgi:hypothetical protein
MLLGRLFYSTPFGLIDGILTITPQLLIFDPNVTSRHNKKCAPGRDLIEFQILLDVNDIVSIDLMVLPTSMYEIIDEKRLDYMKDIYLTMTLINIGHHRAYSKEITDRLLGFKAAGNGIAILFFKVRN